MEINDDHLCQGAALTQIAEHPQFTAINAIMADGRISRSSFLVNNDIAVFLKYAEKPTKTFNEYVFTFRSDHLKEIEHIEQKAGKAFVALVCVQARQICCIREMNLRTSLRREGVRREAMRIGTLFW